MLQPGISCGHCLACLSGRDNECPSVRSPRLRTASGRLRGAREGAGAELVPIPDHVTFADAAAFPLTFVTAWHMLVTRAQVARGDDVLVLAAGSGVGQAAVQIARLHGARVFATAGSDAKLEQARALGADAVIHHHRQDIAEEIKRLTNRRGVDVVIEHVGEATWTKSIRSLARGGRLVTCGATTGYHGAIDLRALFSKQLSILGSYMGTKGELLRAAAFFFNGQLKPIVDARYPLAEAAAAQRRLEESGQFGKIVLDVVMRYQRLSLSLFGVIAFVSIVLAAATVWLFLTNPVTVANAVNEGEVSPLVRDLAQVLYNALSGLLKYL